MHTRTLTEIILQFFSLSKSTLKNKKIKELNKMKIDSKNIFESDIDDTQIYVDRSLVSDLMIE